LFAFPFAISYRGLLPGARFKERNAPERHIELTASRIESPLELNLLNWQYLVDSSHWANDLHLTRQ